MRKGNGISEAGVDAKAAMTPEDEIVTRAERLVADLKTANDFGEQKNAVLRFLARMDGRSRGGLGVLGDMDFAILFLDSLERRRKTAAANILLRAAAFLRTQRPSVGKTAGGRKRRPKDAAGNPA